MGWYHVNNSGKGMVLGSKYNIKFDPKVFCDYYSKKTGKECSLMQMLREIQKEFPDWYVGENATGEDLLECASELCSLALHNIFEDRYGYPKDSFYSICDYNEDIMLFCDAQWPPKEYNKILAELTENKLEKQLQEFLFAVTRNEELETKELEICEEYIKE